MEQLIDFHAPEVQAVLDTLLKDKSTGKNIIWATDPPEELQTVMYEPVTDRSQITTQQLGLTHYEVVLPRMMKQTDTQQQRTRKKGEVFSPAWVCNKMNNALDADWFGGLGAGETAGQFTVELPQGWQTVETPVQFPACGGKTPAWVQYVQSRRLEVTCGEAPFLASRYDAATGEMIPVARRIGILDRKLRVVSENAATEEEWRKYATHAVQSTYGYEYQGDNLLLARVNLLLTYAEHLQARWQRKPIIKLHAGTPFLNSFKVLGRSMAALAPVFHFTGYRGRLRLCRPEHGKEVKLFCLRLGLAAGHGQAQAVHLPQVPADDGGDRL